MFFTRPGNSVELRALDDKSAMIAEAVAKAPEGQFQTGATAYDWFTRRIKYQRINNRTVSRLGSMFLGQLDEVFLFL